MFNPNTTYHGPVSFTDRETGVDVEAYYYVDPTKTEQPTVTPLTPLTLHVLHSVNRNSKIKCHLVFKSIAHVDF
jgi:hypothetical protein